MEREMAKKYLLDWQNQIKIFEEYLLTCNKRIITLERQKSRHKEMLDSLYGACAGIWEEVTIGENEGTP